MTGSTWLVPRDWFHVIGSRWLVPLDWLHVIGCPFQYDGYTSCPLLTKKGQCIMAEFGYDGQVLETLPINQANPMRFTYFLKVHMMPTLYWKMLLKWVVTLTTMTILSRPSGNALLPEINTTERRLSSRDCKIPTIFARLTTNMLWIPV